MFREEMSETQIEVCGKCDAEIDPTRRAGFTLKHRIRVCESFFRDRDSTARERSAELKFLTPSAGASVGSDLEFLKRSRFSPHALRAR
jgi:hypothetical protein